MKSKRFTEGQIISILKQAQAGTKIVDLWRRHGIRYAAFHQLALQVRGIEFSDA